MPRRHRSTRPSARRVNLPSPGPLCARFDAEKMDIHDEDAFRIELDVDAINHNDPMWGGPYYDK